MVDPLHNRSQHMRFVVVFTNSSAIVQEKSMGIVGQLFAFLSGPVVRSTQRGLTKETLITRDRLFVSSKLWQKLYDRQVIVRLVVIIALNYVVFDHLP